MGAQVVPSAPNAAQPKPTYKNRALKVLEDAAWKALQIFVGCLFCVILHTQWAIATGIRIFHKPPALEKCKPSRDVHLVTAATVGATATVSSQPVDATKGDDDSKTEEKPAIMIRAIAAAPQAMKPVMIYNEPSKGHDSQAWKIVGPYVKLYGRNAIANSQLFNPEFIHYFVPGMGSLPYVVGDIYNRVIVSVIGDPLTHKSYWRTITEMFIKEFPNTFFYHASVEYAQVLHDIGYYINDVGAETTLQVQQWTYSSKTRTVRAAARSAREAGVRIRELKPEELTEQMRLKLQHEISGDWLQKKAVADRELRVFVRNVDYDNMELAHGVRIFVAEQHHPAHAPPAVVDAALQGLPANVKPPKPPRRSKSGLAGQSSGALSRSNSVLTTTSSLSSMPSLSAMSTLGAEDAAAVAAAAAGVTPARPSSTGTPFASHVVFEGHEVPAHETEPELIGFVLLDPLWEANEEVGYVSSMCRMKRTAHQGTLKLLYEDIISKLRAEGRRELAFGFAPFFNVRDEVFSRYVHWIRWTNLYFYHLANNLYAFQNLAFSKIRYGAGIDGNKFRDPNVKMTHIYMATPRYAPDMQILDLYVLCMYVGFMAEMFDTLLKLVGLRRGGANLQSDDDLPCAPSMAL